MGSYDAAGMCKFIGLFLFDTLGKAFPYSHFAFYKDDALALAKNPNGPARDRLRILSLL